MSQEVKELFHNKRYNEILDRIDDNEENLDLLELRGISAIQIHDYKSSEITFKKLLSRNNKPSHYYHLGLSLMQLKHFNEAINAFNESMIADNLSIASRVNLAHCLFQMYKNDEAETTLLDLLKQNFSVKAAHFMLLNFYKNNKLNDKLNTHLNLSKNTIGEDYEWFKCNCYSIYHAQDYKKLIEYILANNIETIEILSLLANSYNKNSGYHNSVKVFKKIVEMDPNKAVHWYNLASAYSHLTSDEDLEIAITCATKCLQLNSNYHEAYLCKAIVYEKQSKYKLAIIEIKSALLLNSKELKYLLKLSELLNLLNQNTESLRVLNEILSIDPNYKLAIRLKGIIELQLKQFESSESTLVKALQIDNTDQRAIAYYAISKLAQNKTNEVEEFLALGNLVKVFHFNPELEYKDLKEFNLDFEKDIKNHSLLRREPNGLAARNGYLTDDLFKDKTKSIVLFKKLLEEKINLYINQLPDDLSHHMLRHKTKDFKLNSWATWVKGDGFIDKHIHEESWISGAYYCKTPDIIANSKKHEGYFQYGCIPNDIRYEIDKYEGYIKPEEGMLVIFPSYLYHQTIPHNTDEDRISIAFDLTPNSWLM
jgi:uncharacterized protein (TIGR02466 family)